MATICRHCLSPARRQRGCAVQRNILPVKLYVLDKQLFRYSSAVSLCKAYRKKRGIKTGGSVAAGGVNNISALLLALAK